MITHSSKKIYIIGSNPNDFFDLTVEALNILSKKTKFFITRVDLKGYVLNDIEGDPDHLVVSIAPIPGRICIFNSKVQHTATGFRSNPRFVPSLKFVNADLLKSEVYKLTL